MRLLIFLVILLTSMSAFADPCDALMASASNSSSNEAVNLDNMLRARAQCESMGMAAASQLEEQREMNQ